MEAQPILTTERLTLRPFHRADAVPLFEMLSNEDMMRYWDSRARALADAEAFVTATINAPQEKTCDFIIERDGRVIGKAGMWNTPEIGFFVHPGFQKQGYAREALSTIIPQLFRTYDLQRLTADADPRNTASISLLASLGFVETHRAERTIEIEGEWCDSVYLALKRLARGA